MHKAKPWRMQKTIEAIQPLEEGEVKEMYHQLYGLRRVYESGAQDTVVMHQKTLLYSSMLMGKVQLTLDHRESYDLSRMGRVYDVEVKGDFVLITFKQHDAENNVEYEHYLGIKGVKNVQVLNKWREKHYPYDEERKAQSDYWVYDAITFIPKHKVVFSASETKAEARTLCDIAHFHFDDILSNVHLHVKEKLPHYNNIYNSKQHSAASMSSWSLQQLHQKFQFGHQIINGIYAGYPWFFQLWSRDELISLGGALTLAHHLNDEATYQNIKSILARHIKSILGNGTLANRYPHSKLGSIDSFGWLAKRITDFIRLLQKENKLYTLFEIPELILWHKLLKEGLEKAKKHHQENGLFKNGFNETWMDTSYHDDGRSGFRIEIQALHYAVYDAIIVLGKLIESKDVPDVADEQKKFRELIRSKFLINGRLIDGFNNGLNDWSYRPNVFLAGFVAFHLFSKDEWEKIAAEYLEELLTPWGGLQTIESTHALYCPEYTGQTNESYHRGDSWYFVNNLAAIVLHYIDPELFKDVIQLIAEASATDILDIGLMGHGSEISSADEQKAQGALSQAWSVATYLELMEAIYPK